MTTEQEFKTAIDMMINCNGTISCGCQVDREQARLLKRLCKNYLKYYEERFK